MGRRITDVRVGGAPLAPGRRYKVASWASMGPEAPGPPAPEVLAQHLRELGRVRIDPPSRVRVIGA
jgi:sulfur-oxidizing protein SoxB